MSDAISRNNSGLESWLAMLNNKRGQITTTVYDLPYPGFVGVADTRQIIEQKNLRNRVSYTTITDTGNVSLYNQGTFYTYDILGNVDFLLQDYGCSNYSVTANVMNKNGNRWKKTGYKHDLISGKVNMVMYQYGWRDGFFHRYSYDAENRLTLVETSRDSLIWEKDARYEYYRHGPLARVMLGEQQVQGIDYAYTLQGWLKGINSTGGTDSFDMGGDGRYSGLNHYTARDALGLTLNYFRNDYVAVNGKPFPGHSGKLPVGEFRQLYNGNISSSSVYQKKFDGEVGGPLIFYNYRYDQLNRLTHQDAYTGIYNASLGSWDTLATMGDRLKERIAYDANGNILKYLRNSIDPKQVKMDSLSYSYYPNSNKLRRITDTVGTNTFTDNLKRIIDIDGQPDSNYVYDAIGNLIKDKQENIDTIKWSVYGKINEITRTATAVVPASNIRYTYDAMGNRISQVVTSNGTKHYTWYVRDAQGNILSTYSAQGHMALDSLPIKVADRYMYGSSRLGTITVDDGIAGGPGKTEDYYENRKFPYERGYKQYELTNHLGNVLATVSDRKFGVSSGGSSLIDHYEPHIVTAQDYYPFGMLSRVALPNNNKSYRFGFNGQEMNNDVKGGLGNSYTAQYWEYDSRIGRRWNLDPKPIGGLSQYSAFNNSPILLNDVLGDTSKLGTRVMGALKVVGGLLEMGAGGAGGAATSWTGVGAIGGGALVIHGADVTSSGFMQLWTGEEKSSFTNKGITTGLQKLGVSQSNAQTAANWTEIGIGLFGGGKPTVNLFSPLSPEGQLAAKASALAKADAAATEAAAKVLATKVATFAKENAIYSSVKNNTMYPEIVKTYLNQMKSSTFDAAAKENVIGGFIDKAGRYIIGEGHHRMTAAIQYFFETGNKTFVNQILTNGRWTVVQDLKSYGITINPFPVK